MNVEIKAPVVPSEKPGQYYIDLDGIRLIVLYGEVVGWYIPGENDKESPKE